MIREPTNGIIQKQIDPQKIITSHCPTCNKKKLLSFTHTCISAIIKASDMQPLKHWW